MFRKYDPEKDEGKATYHVLVNKLDEEQADLVIVRMVDPEEDGELFVLNEEYFKDEDKCTQ